MSSGLSCTSPPFQIATPYYTLLSKNPLYWLTHTSDTGILRRSYFLNLGLDGVREERGRRLESRRTRPPPQTCTGRGPRRVRQIPTTSGPSVPAKNERTARLRPAVAGLRRGATRKEPTLCPGYRKKRSRGSNDRPTLPRSYA